MPSWWGAVPDGGDPAHQWVGRRPPEGKGHSHSTAELESDEIHMWILCGLFQIQVHGGWGQGETRTQEGGPAGMETMGYWVETGRWHGTDGKGIKMPWRGSNGTCLVVGGDGIVR